MVGYQLLTVSLEGDNSLIRFELIDDLGGLLRGRGERTQYRSDHYGQKQFDYTFRFSYSIYSATLTGNLNDIGRVK